MTDETKSKAAAAERKEEHDKEQAKLPGSISSGGQSAKSDDKEQAKVEAQQAKTQEVYSQVAEDTKKLHEVPDEVEKVEPYRLPDEPLPGDLPPYSTALAEKESESDGGEGEAK